MKAWIYDEKELALNTAGRDQQQQQPRTVVIDGNLSRRHSLLINFDGHRSHYKQQRRPLIQFGERGSFPRHFQRIPYNLLRLIDLLKLLFIPPSELFFPRLF